MTDFVHEAPKDPNKASAPKEEKPTTERERMKKYILTLRSSSPWRFC